MSTGFRPGDRIQITDPDHPHFPRHGEFCGWESMKIIRVMMAKLKLDSGPGIGSTDECYASQGQFMAEQVVLPKSTRKRGK